MNWIRPLIALGDHMAGRADVRSLGFGSTTASGERSPAVRRRG
jgi:hypothetical protein